jgi:hypothetical protein|tara:strand:- start:1230 stop:1421 length:192 start_codon:yes stop_codon:yes gene_type:complete
MTVTDPKLKNLGRLELLQKLSERITHQQEVLLQSRQQVEVLRQEHQQLKQLFEQTQIQTITDN